MDKKAKMQKPFHRSGKNKIYDEAQIKGKPKKPVVAHDVDQSSNKRKELRNKSIE